MKIEEIVVNGCPVVISVEHVTSPGEGWCGNGSRFIAVCKSLEELNSVLNDPHKQPPPYWQWKIDFQDDLE